MTPPVRPALLVHTKALQLVQAPEPTATRPGWGVAVLIASVSGWGFVLGCLEVARVIF